MPGKFIDIHCHPTSLAYAKSFNSDNPDGKLASHPKAKLLAWQDDPPNAWDRLIQRLASVCKYSQCDFTTLTDGNFKCICTSLHSPERRFVDLLYFGSGCISDGLVQFITSFGKHRIDFLQRNKNYYLDLDNEYKYYLKDNKVDHLINGKYRRYVLVNNFSALEDYLKESDRSRESIYVIMTVEGMHNLQCVDESDPSFEQGVLYNLEKMKNWDYKPFFVTFAHHFFNGLCGHAQSLSGRIRDGLTDQEDKINTGLTYLGCRVLKSLIDNSNGKRIYVDIKHMSYQSRKQYVEFLKCHYLEEYMRGDLPIIISHGACNGKISEDDPYPSPGLECSAARMFPVDINFYDEEIIEMAKSGGIIGLQLDERVIASKKYRKSLSLLFASERDRKMSNSLMVWNNIQHIVQLLDFHNIFAWDCITIGSDFGGVIDPINLFWTSKDMSILKYCIERHANTFLRDPTTVFRRRDNLITGREAVDRIFHENAWAFLKKYFG